MGFQENTSCAVCVAVTFPLYYYFYLNIRFLSLMTAIFHVITGSITMSYNPRGVTWPKSTNAKPFPRFDKLYLHSEI